MQVGIFARPHKSVALNEYWQLFFALRFLFLVEQQAEFLDWRGPGRVNQHRDARSALQPNVPCSSGASGLQVTAGSQLTFADSEQQAWAWRCLPSADGFRNATQTGPGLMKRLQTENWGRLTSASETRPQIHIFLPDSCPVLARSENWPD